MCFYNDYDWTAEVNEWTCIRSPLESQCHDCCRVVRPREWIIYIHQQEHECCQICEDEWSDDYDESVESAGCEHRYGETFDGCICRECGLILAAIYELEEKEGCPEGARQPVAGELGDAVHWEPKYQRYALERFPELKTHRFLESAQAE
jgi:hypothetical protein